MHINHGVVLICYPLHHPPPTTLPPTTHYTTPHPLHYPPPPTTLPPTTNYTTTHYTTPNHQLHYPHTGSVERLKVLYKERRSSALSDDVTEVMQLCMTVEAVLRHMQKGAYNVQVHI